MKKNKLIICKDVLFSEKASWDWKEKKVQDQITTFNGELENQEDEVEDKDILEGPQEISPIASSQSNFCIKLNLQEELIRSLSDVYVICNFCVVELECFEDVIIEAKRDFVNEKKKTWKLVERPKDKKVIGVKWIFKIKFNPDDSIQKTKTRLVAKGYSKQPKFDFHKTFVPIAWLGTIITLLALVTKNC